MVSGGEQRNSAIHVHVSSLPQTPLPARLLRYTEQSSCRYAVGPCWLSSLNIAVFVSVHPKLPNCPFPRSWQPQVPSLNLWVCFVNKFICIIFFLDCTYDWSHTILLLYLTYFTHCDNLQVEVCLLTDKRGSTWGLQIHYMRLLRWMSCQYFEIGYFHKVWIFRFLFSGEQPWYFCMSTVVPSWASALPTSCSALGAS